MPGTLTAALASYPIVVLEGCDGTGKTTLATALAAQHGHTVIHSGRTPDGTDLAARYQTILATPGKLALDRGFVSELVYGPVDHGRSRLALPAAIALTQRVAARGGVLVHLTGRPDIIAARLRARDGAAPATDRISVLIRAYHSTFATLSSTAAVLTIGTTTPQP